MMEWYYWAAIWLALTEIVYYLAVRFSAKKCARDSSNLIIAKYFSALAGLVVTLLIYVISLNFLRFLKNLGMALGVICIIVLFVYLNILWGKRIAARKVAKDSELASLEQAEKKEQA